MKKIKNNTGSTKIWRGQEVLAGIYYTIQEHEYNVWLYDSVLETDINSGDAIFNDGTQDYTDPAEALDVFRAVNATCNQIDKIRKLFVVSSCRTFRKKHRIISRIDV